MILRPKDPYQDRPLPYIIGSERWKNSSKIGLETSSSESDHPEEDDSDSDSNGDDGPVSKPITLQNRRIARLSSSSSESNDYNADNNFTSHVDDNGSNKNQDIFDSESDITTAANSLPKVSYTRFFFYSSTVQFGNNNFIHRFRIPPAQRQTLLRNWPNDWAASLLRINL